MDSDPFGAARLRLTASADRCAPQDDRLGRSLRALRMTASADRCAPQDDRLGRSLRA
jgi:hypothetical protein